MSCNGMPLSIPVWFVTKEITDVQYRTIVGIDAGDALLRPTVCVLPTAVRRFEGIASARHDAASKPQWLPTGERSDVAVAVVRNGYARRPDLQFAFSVCVSDESSDPCHSRCAADSLARCSRTAAGRERSTVGSPPSGHYRVSQFKPAPLPNVCLAEVILT